MRVKIWEFSPPVSVIEFGVDPVTFSLISRGEVLDKFDPANPWGKAIVGAICFHQAG